MDANTLKSFPWELWLPYAVIITGVPLIVNVLFAAGIASDAGLLRREGVEIRFVSPIVWCLATVFGGVFVLAVYWLIHHSALRRDAPLGGFMRAE